MKSILMSIQPYWGFLIIAKEKGLDLAKYGLHEKTVEARKRVPTSPDWDKKVALYFSKDKKSLARVPEEYRGEVAKLCGKVVGEFVCDDLFDFIQFGMGIAACKIEDGKVLFTDTNLFSKTCLSAKEMEEYLGHDKDGYGLHISDLKIYDEPKELSEFRKPCDKSNEKCITCKRFMGAAGLPFCDDLLTRPPQSWQFVEEVKI